MTPDDRAGASRTAGLARLLLAVVACGCSAPGGAADAGVAERADAGGPVAGADATSGGCDAGADADAAGASDAAEDRPSPPPACLAADDPASGVDWVGSLSPSADYPPAWRVPPASLEVTAEVYAAQKTEAVGPAPGIQAQIWSNVSGACQARDMAFDADSGPEGHNDRYKAALPLAGVGPGIYRYGVRAGDGAQWRSTPQALLLVDPLVAVDRILEAWPPNARADAARDPTLRDLDACLLSAYLAGAGGFLDVAAGQGLAHDFYRARVARAVAALAAPAAEPEVVLLYNAGLVYRTPTVSVGIDLVLPEAGDLVGLSWPREAALEQEIAARIDLLLVTHGHADHADLSLMAAVVAAGKPVVAPRSVASLVPGSQGIDGDADLAFGATRVEAFTGPHAYDDALSRTTDHRHYEVAPADGPRLLHSGDLDYTRGLRLSGEAIGVAALKAGGVSPDYDDQSASDRGDDVDAFMLAVEAARPALAIPVHLMELGHPVGGGREGYGMALDFRARVEGAGVRYAVLGWGDHLPVAAR